MQWLWELYRQRTGGILGDEIMGAHRWCSSVWVGKPRLSRGIPPFDQVCVLAGVPAMHR